MRSILLALLASALVSTLSAQARWTSRNPAPTAASLTALAGGNGLYVGVGGSGLIVVSTDGGEHWDTSKLFTGENLNNVSYAGGSFFARGDSGTVFVSGDGLTWHQRVNGNIVFGSGPLGHAAASGNNAWIISSGNSPYSFPSLLASTDATTFSLITTVSARAVAFGAGKFIAVAGTVFNTSTDGVTWTPYTPTGLTGADELCFGSGQFLARLGQTLYHSADALQWTEISGVTATAIVFAKDRFIAQSASTGGPITSLDGTTWVAPTDSVLAVDPSHIVSDGDNFAAFINYKLYTSTDALHWTQRGTDFTTTATQPGLAFAANRFLTGDGHTSTDGVTWGTDGYAVPAELALDSHVHTANDRFFIFSKHAIFTSADGLTGQRLTDLAFNARDVAYGAGRYVIVGHDDIGTSGRIATSTDGQNWSELSPPSGAPALEHVAFAAGLFVAIHTGGYIYTSPDGLTWTRRYHVVDILTLEGIAYGAGRWIIAGNPGLTSTDGLDWSRAATVPDATTIAFANDTFILRAYSGSTSNYVIRPKLTFATSADGLHWTWRDSDGLSATTFAYGAGSWVGVGTYGRLIQSSAADFAQAPTFASGLTASLDPANPAHLTLTAEATGTDTTPLSYQWYRGTYAITDATTSALDFPNWTNSAGDSYHLVASNAYGSAIIPYRLSTRTRQLDPAEYLGPLQFSARLLDDGQLNLSVTTYYDYSLIILGPGPIDFQWFKDGAAIAGANGPNITVPFDPVADASANYSLKVTNLFGSVDYGRTLQPTVVNMPGATQANLGASTTLLAVVSVPHNSGAVTFTWTKDGQVVKTDSIGASTYASVMDMLTLTSLTAADYGLYQVTVTTAFGTVASNYFTVSAPPVTRLTNLSVRAHVGTGDDVLIAGFVGSGTTGGPNVLVRGIGPTLADLGVDSPLPRAHLGFNNATGTTLATNDHWDASPGYDATFLRALFNQLGAFALTEGSFDAALLRPGSLNTDQPPRFTAVLSGVADTTGVGLIEVYESVATTQRLVNLSARARVASGEDVLIAGFVIDGTEPLKVLIRGVGPGLIAQGVSAALTNPKLTLYNAAGEPIHNNDQWSDAANLADLRAATTTVGAFALTDGSADAAMLETLDPGVYTVHVTSVDGSAGIALVEIYAVP